MLAGNNELVATDWLTDRSAKVSAVGAGPARLNHAFFVATVTVDLVAIITLLIVHHLLVTTVGCADSVAELGVLLAGEAWFHLAFAVAAVTLDGIAVVTLLSLHEDLISTNSSTN